MQSINDCQRGFLYGGWLFGAMKATVYDFCFIPIGSAFNIISQGSKNGIGSFSLSCRVASILDAAKWNRELINSEYLDFTTLHRGYWLLA